MKHYRVTTKDNNICSLTFFSSVEALYLSSETLEDDTKIINLRADDFLDVEWLGCEFVYDKNEHKCYNLVNVAYARSADNGSGFVVEHITGWIGDDLPLNDVNTCSLSIRRLSENEGIKLEHPFEDNEE